MSGFTPLEFWSFGGRRLKDVRYFPIFGPLSLFTPVTFLMSRTDPEKPKPLTLLSYVNFKLNTSILL